MSVSHIHEIVPDIKTGRKYEWIYKNREEIDGMIISPDTDGFLSALLLNVINRWKVVGFYDGRTLAILEDHNRIDEEKGTPDLTKYAFIDVEILRPSIPSIGHHMIVRRKDDVPELIKSIEKVCIQPNILRNYDVQQDFSKKYPFGTFHLLLSLLYLIHKDQRAFDFDSKNALAPTIYADGVFKNMFNYPEIVFPGWNSSQRWMRRTR